MNEADIQRINELARKSKTVEGLTEAACRAGSSP